MQNRFRASVIGIVAVAAAVGIVLSAPIACRGTVVALPDSSKVIAHRTYSGFLFRR